VTEAPSFPAAGESGAGSVEPPARAEGVTLIGEMKGSGYRTPPALARRVDGQTVQLTPLLYATLAALDGRRSYADVASVVAQATGKPVSEGNARDLVDKLRPMGLAVPEDGSAPDLRRSNPLLGLRFKIAVTDEEKTRRLTTPFAALFNVGVAVPVLATFGWIAWWVLFDKGLASATHEAFARPGLLLAVIAVTVLSAGFHEFGHAAAARRGGAVPGVMGAGLYLVWPAFYTDVTDSYRLGRGGRLRTDLGGLYFNAIVAVATVGVWWATKYDAILLLVATQVLQMLRQLLPFVRFDGYHVLADLTGVPDLFQRIGPILRSLVPWHPTPPQATALKPWARLVVTAWVLTVVPVLLGVMVLMVLALPRVVGTAWASARAQQEQMGLAFGDGDLVGASARAFAALIVLLPIAASAFILVRLLRRVGGTVWQRTNGRPFQRGLAGLTAVALLAGLALAWWPSPDRYRPIQAYEDGTLTSVLPVSSSRAGVAVGSEGAGTVMWPNDSALPTRDAPQLAAVLVPQDATTVTEPIPTTGQPDLTTSETSAPEGTSPSSDPKMPDEDVATSPTAPETDPWIFPFDEPLAPGTGDTQALAVNTTDDTATYAVAFALIWADGDEPVDNTNEAYALASCDNCAAISVAFQIVLVVGDANVAVPQNLAVAVNYDCTSCLTYALAVQLFITLDGPLSDDAIAEVEALWQQIAAYGANIGQVPLDEIQTQLTAYEQQLLAIIEEDEGSLTEPTESPSSSPTDETSTDTPTDSPSEPATSPTEAPLTPSETSSTSPSTPSETVSPTSPTSPSSTVPTESPSSSLPSEPTTSVSPTTGTTTSEPTVSPTPTP
jgi:putative peptide zinc metalloprotease protein